MALLHSAASRVARDPHAVRRAISSGLLAAPEEVTNEWCRTPLRVPVIAPPPLRRALQRDTVMLTHGRALSLGAWCIAT